MGLQIVNILEMNGIGLRSVNLELGKLLSNLCIFWYIHVRMIGRGRVANKIYLCGTDFSRF